jgi:hypothetical protein
VEQAPGAHVGTRSLRGLAGAGPVEVFTSPDGTPHALMRDGRRRLVVAMRDSWRVQDRWWTDDPVDRSYFDVIVEPGRHALIFRENSGDWFIHA